MNTKQGWFSRQPEFTTTHVRNYINKGDWNNIMLSEFIEYLEEQVRNHSIYVWGAQGQTGAQLSEAWIWAASPTQQTPSTP